MSQIIRIFLKTEKNAKKNVNYSDDAILSKNPTNALIYVNTILVTLLNSYKFQPSRRHPQGVLIHCVNWVNKICVQM